jgi:hypothetical protein
MNRLSHHEYHRPRWCPDGLNRSQKRRVQWLHSLEEAEARYLRDAEEGAPGFGGQSPLHAEKGSRALLGRSGGQNRQELMRRHRLMHIWCLYSPRSSTLEAVKIYQ